MTWLDWGKHAVGAPKPCRLCGGQALMRDQNREPCHKVCVERDIDRKAARVATRGN